MREDLNKLMCERERARSDDHYVNYRHLKKFADDFDCDDHDELFTGVGSGHRESMKHRYGYDSKSFSENLNPLYGFIHKSVGKKWDNVYGEICRVFDKRSVINQHILIHLFQYVETKDVYVGKDGQLWYQPTEYRSIFSKPTTLKESYIQYYVDPRDGVLKQNHDYKTSRQSHREHMEAHAEEEAKVKRVIDKTTELHKINNCWFAVKFEDVDGSRETQMVSDHWRKNYLSTTTVYPVRYDVLVKHTVIAKRVAVTKRQLSRKELRRQGLTN